MDPKDKQNVRLVLAAVFLHARILTGKDGISSEAKGAVALADALLAELAKPAP